MKIALYSFFKSLFAALFFFVYAAGWGQAALPVNYDGGRSPLPIGFSQIGLGTDYASSPKLKFDDTSDELKIFFNGAASQLNYNVKGNPSSGSNTSGSFQIFESTDGTNYTLVRTISNKDNTTSGYTDVILNSSRYVKFVYTSKTSGNIALGAINIIAASCTTPLFSFSSGITVNKLTTDIPFNNTFTSQNTSAKVYSSSNPSVATVDSSGQVTILGAGTTTIGVTQVADATYCAVSSSYTLNVTSASPVLAVTGTANNGSSCTGTPATKQTYTISNTGGSAASGIAVSSSNPQFVVSNISSTTVAAAGTITFDVIFTPTAGGTQNATLTVTSTISGSNTATYNISGSGIASVTPTVTTGSASALGTLSSTLNGNIAVLGVCPNSTQRGFVYSVTASNNNPTHGGTAVTTTPVAGLATGNYSLPLTGLAANTQYSYRAYVFDGTDYTYGAVQAFTTLQSADRLVFVGVPASGTVGNNLTAFTVEARRPDNTVDNTFTGSISISKASGPGNLTGTLSVSAVAGVATFNTAKFDAAGTYTLNASSGSLTGSTSGNIVVNIVAANVGNYLFTGNTCTNYVASGVAANLSFSNISPTGITCNTNVSTNIFGGSASWGNAIDTGKYLEFTVTPASGYTLTATSVFFDVWRSGAGANNYTVRSSLDSFTSDLGTGSVTTTLSAKTVTLTSVFADLNSPVTFRIYGWGGSSTGDWRLDNIGVNGYVITASPRPRIAVKQNTVNIPNNTGSFGFGNQLVGTSSAATTFTIENTGTMPLTLGTIALSGTNASEFAVTPAGSASLDPGSSTTFSGTFSPSSAGAKTATVTIPNNDNTNFTFNITGTGTLNGAPYNASISKSCLGNTQLMLQWTAPSSGTTPTGYIVYALAGTTAPAIAAASAGNASSYTANSDFSAATSYGTLGKAVYKGNGTAATITGLIQGQQYTFKVVAYNGETATGWASGINTGGSWNATYTIKAPEVGNPAATVAPTSSVVSWNVVPASPGCYEYMVVASQGAVTFTPSGDGSAYSANDVFSGNNQVVYKGIGNKVTVTGLTEGLQYCYKIFVREVNSSQWSEGVSVCRTTGLSYCDSYGNTDFGTGITGVEFNTINNLSAAGNQPDYSDYTTLSTAVSIGQSYDLSVKVNTDGDYTTTAKVWIDWNRSGTFEVSTEEYDLGTALNVADGYTTNSPLIVTVPASAQPGMTRMRVSNKYDLAATPCENGYDGEVEDYTIEIVKPANAEINIKGGSISIPSGSTAVNALNNTLFAATDLGSSSVEKTFTIENLGLTVLNLTGSPVVKLEGDHPADFTITEQPAAATVGINGSLTFKVKFNPTTADVRSAVVSIGNDDPTGSENPYTFRIQGKGQCTAVPAVTMLPASGPANTLVTLTSAVNDLTGAEVKLNGVTLIPLSVNAGEIKIKIPAGAQDGDLTVRLQTGCVFTQVFDVVTYENTACEGAATGALPTDLIIYEVYDDEKGSGGFVSIYNGTSAAKNLSSYEIYRAGDPTITPKAYTTGLTGSILPGELKIIRYSGENACATPASTGNGSFGSGFNGDDVFELRSSDGAIIYDTVHAPFDKGYYMKRKAGQFSGSNVHVPANWEILNLNEGDCEPAGVPPVLPGGNPPAITSQPVFTPDCHSIVLSVTAAEGFSGGNDLAYQWYRLAPGDAAWTAVSDTGVYSGAATPVLTVSSLTGLDDYQFYVQVRENGLTCYRASDAVQIKDLETRWTGSAWSKGIPQTYSKVIIEADYNTKTHGALDICELTVNSGNFVIEKDFPVRVQYKVSNKATETNFIIENDGQLLQVDDVENTGKITVKRNMTFTDDRKEYNYLASPVEGQHMKLLFGAASNTPYVLVLKESTNLFVNAAAADYNIIGKGFAVKEAIDTYTDSVAHFKGKPVNGRHPVTVTKTSAGRGWNLIGNPYASNLDLKLYYEQNDANMLPEFRFWDNRVNNTYVQYGGAYNGYSYAIYNALSDEGNPAPGGDAGNNTGTPGTPTQATGLYRYAKVGQGFLIRAVNLGDHELNFRNTQRTVNQPDRGFFGKSEVLKDRYRLQLITPSDLHLTNTVVYFEGGSNSFGLEDSRHPSSGASDAFYSLAGTDKTVINGRAAFEDTDVIALGNKHYVSGNYTIRAIDRIGVFANGQSIYLKDKVLNIITDLTAGDYAFTTEAGDFTNRFEIVYKPEVVLAADDSGRSATEVYRDGSDFVVRADRTVETVEVFDASGRLLITVNGSARELRFSASPLTDGMYVVKARLKGGDTFTKKIRK